MSGLPGIQLPVKNAKQNNLVEILTEIKNVDISVELRSDSSTTEDSTDYDLPTDQNGT